MQGIFVYLDLLGFSNYTRTDLVGAVGLIDSQRAILDVKLGDAEWYKSNGTPLEPFQRDRLVTSFVHFLPFSDSLCIAATDANLFVPQLAHFLISAFSFTGHAYAHGDTPGNPENVEIPVIGLHGITMERRNWFPVLWRGGVSFGQFERVGTRGIVDGNRTDCPLLVGDAVVRAVGMEKPGDDEALRKGPRLFFDPPAMAAVTDSRLLPYFDPAPGIPNCMELLWPAFHLVSGNNPESELLGLHELLEPAVVLWRSKRGTKVELHYFEFIRLICRGALRWATVNGLSQTKARGILSRQLDQFGATNLAMCSFE